MSLRPFLMETRQMAGGFYGRVVGVKCKRCGRHEWRKGDNQGIANRIFHNAGWLLGSGIDRDVCPGCRNQRPPNNLTAAQKRAAYCRIEGVPRAPTMKSVLMTGSVMDPSGSGVVETVGGERPLPPGPVDPAILQSDNLAKALGALGRVVILSPHLENEPVYAAPKTVDTDGQPTNASREAVRYQNKTNAHRGARRFLIGLGIEDPREGVHYKVQRLGSESYTFQVLEAPKAAKPEKVKPKRKQHAHTPVYAPKTSAPGSNNQPFMTRGFTARWPCRMAAEKYLRRIGISDPTEGTHFTVHSLGDGFAWDPINQPKEPPVPDNVRPFPAPAPRADPEDAVVEAVAAIVTAPEHPISTMRAEPPKPPTREDRRLVVDELDRVYDMTAERYRGEDSDKVVAERLNKPRALVTQVRSDLYGDHDRNEAELKAEANLDTLAAEAAKMRDMGIELAALAETVLGNVQKLKGRKL